MKKYEHKIESLKPTIDLQNRIQKILNVVGEDYWEYVDLKYMENVDQYFLLFKREKPGSKI